jgi:iron complex outermembrane receptor protein
MTSFSFFSRIRLRLPSFGAALFHRANALAAELSPLARRHRAARFRAGVTTLLAAPCLLLAEHEHGAPTDGEQPVVLGRFIVNDVLVSGDSHATAEAAGVLKNTPGLEFSSAGGVSSLPVLQGFADDRLRLQVNGMNLISACANHMNPPLSYLAPSAIGRVTIYPAIVPVSLGGDSIGGAIVVDAPAPIFAGPHDRPTWKTEIGGYFRSNGNARGAYLSSALAAPQVALAYHGAFAQAGDYHAAEAFKPAATVAGTRDGALALDGRTVGSTAYEVQNHALRAAVREGTQQAELDLGYQFIPRQGFPNQRMDMTLNRSEQATLRYRSGTEGLRLEARTYYEHTRHAMDFLGAKQYWYGSASTILAPGMPMNTEGRNLGTFARLVLPQTTGDELSVGVETQWYRLDDWWPPSPSVLPAGYTTGGMAPDTFWNINGGERDRYAVFAEWSQRWTDRLTGSLGVRHEALVMNTGRVQGYNNTAMYNGAPLFPATRFNEADRRRVDRNWNVAAQVRYDPSARWSYELGYALKTRSPNLYERYAWSTNTMAMEMINFAGDGNFYVGHLGLKPETAHTVAAMLEVHDAERKQWGVAVSPHFSYVVDFIDARRLPPEVGGSTPTIVANQTLTNAFVYLQYANKTAQLYGVDATAHFPVVDLVALGTLHGRATLSGTRGRNLSTGDNLYHIPPLSAKLAVTHQLGRWTTTVEAETYAAKNKLSAVRNEFRTGGYTVVNLRTTYTWRRVTIEAGIDNLFDRFFLLPLGGAYIGQGPTMSGRAIPWGVGIPGAARTFHLAFAVTL